MNLRIRIRSGVLQRTPFMLKDKYQHLYSQATATRWNGIQLLNLIIYLPTFAYLLPKIISSFILREWVNGTPTLSGINIFWKVLTKDGVNLQSIPAVRIT